VTTRSAAVADVAPDAAEHYRSCFMPLDRPPDDPVFLHSRREALVIVALWAACLVWPVPYCYLNGYTAPATPEELPIVWGMPAWVFYGIALPWAVAGVASIVMCLWFIQDDDLGQADDELPLPPPER